MYLFLDQPHPSAEKKPKRGRRPAIKPVQPHRDRKNDYQRQPKHKKEKA